RSFACGYELSGLYTVGGKNADFDSLSTALRSLYACGLDGNVVFNINSGTYIQDIDLSTAFMDASSSYTVTFTSSAKNADSVSIVSTGTILNMANVKNLTFSHLTFDARSGINAITFNNNCNSINIHNCKILMNPISTNSANIGIYKPNNTNTIDMISIKNNYIDGGYYGINFYGGYYSSNYFYGTNIVIDSNIISNAYFCGLQTYYTSFTSISYNQITSRSSDSYTNFHGMYLNYSNATIIGNKISNPTAISQPYGMRFSYINYMNTSESALIANNEIITNASYSAYGIYFDSYYYRANIFNNSILCKGGSSATSNRGIFITYFTTSSCLLSVKNNLLVNQTYGYPIYFNQTPPASVLTIDYNNYFAPTYIGYYNASITSLSAWKTATSQDAHSVNVNPSFKNININLDLNHSNGLRCLRNTLVQTDINNIARKNNTTIGAYEVIFDLEITKLNKPTHASSFCSQENTDVEVVISNLNQTGINFSIEPIYLHISITGAINYQKDTVISVGSISGLQKDTFLIIPNLALIDTGIYNIKTYINNIDNNINNDTLNSYIYVNPIYSHYDTLTICDSDLPYTYGDSIFPKGTSTGPYTVHYTLSTGCDSLINLALIVNPTYHHYKTVSICDNELPYTYGDSIFPVGTASGTYPVHYTLPTGCDSLITLTLNVNPTYHHYKTLTICDNELPYTYGDSIFPIGTASGTYPVHYTLPTGCDSLITLTLNVNPTYHHYDTITICDNDLPIT
ncbi:MAG: hypothetical protein GX612_03735, partial [Bacteroidales bacterium]|nr:hypothetical protein [Bacteroidales bacterium]